MAVGMFKLSHKQRKNLSFIFVILNILQVLLGFGMTSTSLYVIIAVSPVLHTEKAEINFAFAVTGIFGTHVIFHWIIGIKICYKCFRQAHKKSTSSLLLLWTCVGTNTVINLLIISHLARKMNKHIIRSIKHSITTGMNNYLQEISWKETIDKLQFSKECCGITSFDDWHEIRWLTKYNIDVKSETVKQFRTNEDILTLPITPWSCCKIDFPMQCLHDPIQQSQYAHIWVDEPSIVKNSINTKGCLNSLKKPISSIINLFVLFSSIAFILHMMIFIIARLLYTSTRNSLLLNDPKGIAPGWIFGRGDCRYAGGKTLTEIMGVQDVVVEEPTNNKQKGNKLKTLIASRFKSKKSLPTDDEKNTNQETADETDDNDYTLVPQDDTRELNNTVLEPRDYSKFNPPVHSSKEKVSEKVNRKDKADDSGEPMSMEEELKRLQQ